MVVKKNIAAEDVRFAETIERIQRIIISELTKIAVVHLYSQGYTDADLVNFELELKSPSTMYEQEKIELLGQKVSLARDMIQDKILPTEWVYDNIFNFSKEEKKDVEDKIIEDKNKNSDTHKLKWKVMTHSILVKQLEHQVIWLR